MCTVEFSLHISLFDRTVQLLQRMMNDEDDDDGFDDSKEKNRKQLTRTFSDTGEKEALKRMRSTSVKSSDEKEIFSEKVDTFFVGGSRIQFDGTLCVPIPILPCSAPCVSIDTCACC